MLELKLKSDRRSVLRRQEDEVLANENAHHSRAEEEHKKQIVKNFAIGYQIYSQQKYFKNHCRRIFLSQVGAIVLQIKHLKLDN